MGILNDGAVEIALGLQPYRDGRAIHAALGDRARRVTWNSRSNGGRVARIVKGHAGFYLVGGRGGSEIVGGPEANLVSLAPLIDLAVAQELRAHPNATFTHVLEAYVADVPPLPAAAVKASAAVSPKSSGARTLFVIGVGIAVALVGAALASRKKQGV